MLLENKIAEILNQTRGEREIHDFLKGEPYLVWSTFMSMGGHSEYVLPEFSFAGKYRADFVVMQSFSGGWNVSFIELEPVDEKPFFMDGRQSNRLRGALKQIDDWKAFAHDESASLRSCLADAAQKYDILYPERNLAREPRSVKMPLRDSRTYLKCEYFIVMGRRSDFSEDLTYRKSKFPAHHHVEILTYDRFIQVAENLEQRNEGYKRRTIDEKDKEFLIEFAENPQTFSVPSTQAAQTQFENLNIHGTWYKIRPNEREPGWVVHILGTLYEIFEDRRRFKLYRIEPDGLAEPVAEDEDLVSLPAAIELAEIFERFINFHIGGHSLDLVDQCLQDLREHPPYKYPVADATD
jgi:Domain of unknown function (DUF4263)